MNPDTPDRPLKRPSRLRTALTLLPALAAQVLSGCADKVTSAIENATNDVTGRCEQVLDNPHVLNQRSATSWAVTSKGADKTRCSCRAYPDSPKKECRFVEPNPAATGGSYESGNSSAAKSATRVETNGRKATKNEPATHFTQAIVKGPKDEYSDTFEASTEGVRCLDFRGKPVGDGWSAGACADINAETGAALQTLFEKGLEATEGEEAVGD